VTGLGWAAVEDGFAFEAPPFPAGGLPVEDVDEPVELGVDAVRHLPFVGTARSGRSTTSLPRLERSDDGADVLTFDARQAVAGRALGFSVVGV
jgi:hypothetical protein